MTEARQQTPVDVVAEAWADTELELVPELHVFLGRPGREGEYTDYSPDGRAKAASAAAAALAQLRATDAVDEIDEVTKVDLARQLELAIDEHEAGVARRNVNNLASPVQEVRDIFDLVRTETEGDWVSVAKRLRNVRGALEGYIATLREGIEHGTVPAIRQVAIAIRQAEEQAGVDSFFTAFVASAPVAAAPLARDLEEGARSACEAYGMLAAFLRDELAPVATERDAVGREYYALASRGFLGATIDLDETYEWGVEELRRMAAEQEAIAREILPGATVAEAIAHLEQDPRYSIHGTEALAEWMQGKSDEAIRALGATHFDIPEPVRRLECLIAPTQHGGIYYTPPSEDFSRPGRMWWSVPADVERFDTWRELTTVYHEGVPGHHLQNGQAIYNRAQLNTWRRNTFISGHGEGWALYAERLMEELGYLADPADRLGMLDGQRLRALRVVLDIGVHLSKPRLDGTGVWDYDYALAQMRAHTNMADSSRVFETDRYFGWPGQAPSYKIGERIWIELREDARRRAGSSWDLKAWHKRALDLGGVGLDTLRWALERD